ncbi:MAG: exodeoxyribonuclease VII large subunit, partial [Fusobacterium sp.]|nr:exodeoxyribonuclease VII large subunit [Fusobacterium sp.]
LDMKKNLILRKENYYLKKFPNIFNEYREKIIEKEDEIKKLIEILIENKKNYLESKIDKILLLNPINTLKRGYTVSLLNNENIKSIDNIKINDKITTIISGGKIISNVEEKIYEKNNN